MAQKIKIAPKVGWYGLVRFSPEETAILSNGLNIFNGPSNGIDVYYNLNSNLKLRLGTEYLWGLKKNTQNPIIPEQEISYKGRGFFFTPSLIISSSLEKKFSPFLSFGLTTGIPEMVFNYQNDKAIYTGDILIGINSGIGISIKTIKGINLITELQFSRARYKPTKLVSKSDENVLISELDEESILTPNFFLQQLNFSVGLTYQINNNEENK